MGKFQTKQVNQINYQDSVKEQKTVKVNASFL